MMAPKKQIAGEQKPPPERPRVAAYADSATHLRDHLERIDLLVKAQTIRWRATIGASKPEDHWGMIHVTDAEVRDVYLPAGFGALGELAEEEKAQVAKFGQELNGLTGRIEDSERNTDAATPLRLRTLQRVFGLSDLERDILLVCLLPEWDPRYRRLYGYLQDDASRTQPTVELVASILSSDGNGLDRIRGCLEDHRTLVANSLLLFRNRGDEPLPLRSLRLDDRIAAYLCGSDAPDARLLGLVTWAEELGWKDLHADAQHFERLKHIAKWARDEKPTHGAAVFVRGVYGSGRLATARALASELGIPLLAWDVPRALRSNQPWEEMVLAVFREARLRGAAVYLAGFEALLGVDALVSRLDHLLSAVESYPGWVLMASQTVWGAGARFRNKLLFHLEIGIPGYAQRLALWKAHMPAADQFAKPTPDRDALADALAARFQLTEGQVLDAICASQAHALLREGKSAAILSDDLFEGCRRQASRRLLAFARRIEPRLHLTLADLVLPEANLRQLRDVQHRIRSMQRVHSELGFEHRLRLSNGMVVLFTGASGTGKTMAAECLARELGVDLYKVDLSAIVSKWVGETEKNLHQLFTEAEDSSAIIFFDEADALFGKRGEVKDARDRWANTEVNYLLQRIEDYVGVVILASNLRQNIDEAFLRRISAMVEFPAPNETARVQIWRGMFPAGLKGPSNEELGLLASRIKVPGGSIRNIVVDAAFRATAAAGQEEPVVTLRHLVLASAREFQKLGKPLTKTEFGDEFYRWIEKEIL